MKFYTKDLIVYDIGSKLLESHFLKPFFIIAPDLQFDMVNVFGRAVCPTCGERKLKLSGWWDYYRYVHGKQKGVFY